MDINKRCYHYGLRKGGPQCTTHIQIKLLWDKSIHPKVDITKTCLYNVDPLKPHFYIVKLGFAGVYIILLISAQKHRLWVLVRTTSVRRFIMSTHNLCFGQKYEKYQNFYLKLFSFFFEVKFPTYLNRRVFVM